MTVMYPEPFGGDPDPDEPEDDTPAQKQWPPRVETK